MILSMGSTIEFNDTLQITIEQGFPKELALERHIAQPFSADDFGDRVFAFQKPGLRLFHPAPVRVFLVQNVGGKWLYWGHALIVEQTIHADTQTTSGKFTIEKIYTPEHQRAMSTQEVSKGKEFFTQ